MENLWQDIHYAVRMLKKSPGFTAVAVLTLALGIGANTAMFSVVKAILLEPLRYQDSDRLVILNHYYPQLRAGVSAPGYVYYRDNTHSFENMTAHTAWDANLTGQGEPERLRGLLVSASFFETLGVSPVLGRAFKAEEDQPGGNQVVILTYQLWRCRFGGDRNVLQTTLSLNGRSYTVVGVMPEAFRFGRELGNEMEIILPHRFNAYGRRASRLDPAGAARHARRSDCGVEA
jgi:putative ABC transport system permease protein